MQKQKQNQNTSGYTNSNVIANENVYTKANTKSIAYAKSNIKFPDK